MRDFLMYATGLNGCGHFNTILISLKRRTLFENKAKYSDFKAIIYGFFLYQMIFNMHILKKKIRKNLTFNLLTTQIPKVNYLKN